MKVAVTGATGFVGRVVVKELLKRGIDAVATARSKTKDLPLPAGVNFFPLDIKDASPHAFDLLGRPDVLIHLAWDGLPNYRSLHHFEDEVPIHYRFLKRLIEYGLNTLIVAGTCFEYGMQSGPLHEDLPTMPCTAYGFAKDTLRKGLEFLKGHHNFSFTWARIFYLYGEGQSKTSLLSQLESAVNHKERVFHMSEGEQLRDYLPVEEAAAYLVTLALNKGDYGVVNICSGKPISIRRMVEEWIRKNNWKIELNLGYHPYPDYEPMAFWGAKEKLEKILNGHA